MPASTNPASPAVTAPRPGMNMFAVIVATILLLIPLYVTGAVASKLEDVFKDFGVALPWSTRCLFQVGHAFSSPLGWLVIIALTGGVVLPLATWSSRRPARAAIVLVIAILVLLAYLVTLVWSTWAPLNALVQSLASKPNP